MRELALDLLRSRANGSLGDPYNLRYVVAWSNDGGHPSLECFYPGDKIDEHTAFMASLPQGNESAWEYAGLVECLIAHAVQYSQENVYDEEGQLVDGKVRTVLDPQYLANGLDALERAHRWNKNDLEKLLQIAPERATRDVTVSDANKRIAVLRWQSLLIAKRKKNGVDGVVMPRVAPVDEPPLYSEVSVL
jgi:hypothetical protein